MLTAADVRAARFTATKFRSGYEIAEVDDILARAARTLDHLEQGLTVESDGTPLLTPDDLLNARFSPTELTEGYFVDEVDDLLDEIIDTLNTYIGRASRGEPLVQPAPAAQDAVPAEPAAPDAVSDVSDASVLEATAAAPADERFTDEEASVVVPEAPAEASMEVSDAPADASADAPAAAPADDEPSTDEPDVQRAPAEEAEHFAAPSAAGTLAETPSPAEPFPSVPVWSPPASTDEVPAAWDAPAVTTTPAEPVHESSAEPSGAAMNVEDVDDVEAGAAAEDPAPWEPGFVPPAAPVPTPDWGFNAPAPAADDGVHDTELDDNSFLASTEESPWGSLDGDEPIALGLDEEVRDTENTDTDVPAWLTDAQPEMAAPEVAPAGKVVDEPLTDGPTRVSAFAFAAHPTDVGPDAPTAPIEAIQGPLAVPGTDAVDATAPATIAPRVAPADALDSQGLLRQLTFARATSTGTAKDTVTLVTPDGRVFSAVSVRKTPGGLVVDLG